jgi:PAS domain S-box-containing protein
MTTKGTNIKHIDEIRKQAEKRIPKSTEGIGDMSVLEVWKLIHELHVHQIEMEMQNDELRKSQMELAELRRKYTDLYDFAPVGYFIFDRKGRIIEANVTGAALLGFEKRSLAGQTFHRFITPGHFSIFQSHLQIAFEIKSRQTCKLRLTRKDGSLFDAMIDTVAVIDVDGNFDHYRSSITDITEITKTEEALIKAREETEERIRERTAQLDMANRQLTLEIEWRKRTQDNLIEQSRALEAFFTHSITPIVFLDKDFNFIMVNEAYARACQRDVSEFPGHNHFEFYPSDTEEIFRRVVETKTAYQTFARPFTFPDHPEWGITYWDWSLFPVLDNHGEIDFLVFSLNDVTKKKLAEEEAQRHAQLLDLANDAILICDLYGNISYWNKGAEKLYGWSKNEVIGQNILSLLQTEPLLKSKDVRERFFRDGYWEGERVHTRKDGRKITVHSHWTLQRDDKNKPIAFSEINRDITELKRKEREIHETALYSRRLIEASLDPLVTISARGKIMDVNKATENATGMPRKKLIGSDFSDYFTDPEKARKGYEMVFSQGFVKDYPLAIRHTSGRSMEVLYHATTYKNDRGEVMGVFAAARDITDLRTAQKALQESNDELERRVEERTARLEEINRELESFSYSVSHDLRAPLRAVDGYARMILKKQGDKFDEDTLYKFNVIRSSAHMMGQLIDDLLTFSRLGRKEISMSKLDMHTLINDVWKELRIINPDRNMFLSIHSIPPGCGDRSLVKQVYSNLLGNAVKFTKYRNAAQIEAGGYTDGDEEIYYVKDNGVGFDMTYYNKLFGVFQRLHSTDDFEGTGVGLATVQRIIRRHGGRVWAEGELDRGATFYFSLMRKE